MSNGAFYAKAGKSIYRKSLSFFSSKEGHLWQQVCRNKKEHLLSIKAIHMIIIVFGLPGSGKSYFASRLAGKIGAKYVNSDQLRKELFQKRDYSDREKKIIYEKMVEEMMQAVAQQKNLVLDATFHRKETRELFTDRIHDKEEILFIEVQAEEAIIRERVSRKREYSEADFEVYTLIQEQYEPLTNPHLILQSTNENIDDMLKKAANYLKTNNDERSNK